MNAFEVQTLGVLKIKKYKYFILVSKKMEYRYIGCIPFFTPYVAMNFQNVNIDYEL